MTGGNGGAGHDKCGCKRRDGGRCQRPAGWGTGHPRIGACKLHGGSTPTHEAHALAVMADRADAAALAELDRRNIAPMSNPLLALQELAGESAAWLGILRARVAGLEEMTVRTVSGAEQVRAVILAYERAVDRAAMLAALMAKLDIDDRIVRLNSAIAEAQGGRLAHAVARIVVRLGHPDPMADRETGLVCREELERLAATDD
jgi:hypothetical protein